MVVDKQITRRIMKVGDCVICGKQTTNYVKMQEGPDAWTSLEPVCDHCEMDLIENYQRCVE